MAALGIFAGSFTDGTAPAVWNVHSSVYDIFTIDVFTFASTVTGEIA